jgi:hypothetical protein
MQVDYLECNSPAILRGSLFYKSKVDVWASVHNYYFLHISTFSMLWAAGVYRFTTDAGVNHSFRVHKDLFGGGAFNLAEKYFNGIVVADLPEQLNQELEMYPNPVNGNQIQVKLDKKYQDQQYAISL